MGSQKKSKPTSRVIPENEVVAQLVLERHSKKLPEKDSIKVHHLIKNIAKEIAEEEGLETKEVIKVFTSLFRLFKHAREKYSTDIEKGFVSLRFPYLGVLIPRPRYMKSWLENKLKRE